MFNDHNGQECNVMRAEIQTRTHQIKEGNMSDILQEAVGVLNEKLSGGGFDGSAKFEITDLGAIVMDASGARLSDDAADVTLTADADTFKGILEGDLNPTSAFMTGKLSVDGDMGLAMQLASVLA